MNVYRLTKTLDDYVDFYCDDADKAEVLVVGGNAIDLALFPGLRYIFKCGVGTDNIPNLEGSGIELVMPSDETQYAITDEVSSFAVHLILMSHYRNAGSIDGWHKVRRRPLAGMSALVVGRGKIGSLVEAKLAPIVGRVVTYDIADDTGDTPLDELLPEHDIVTLHVPLTEDNQGLIDPALLGSCAILVNTARGPLVDEQALIDYLRQNPNATAAFDVFWDEPYEGPLLDLDNFLATPHVGSFSDGFTAGLFKDLQSLMARG